MSTYKEQRENLQHYVLLEDCEVIGSFGNLKKLCDFMQNKDFYKYNTIIRKKEFPIEYGSYKVYKVKHY